MNAIAQLRSPLETIPEAALLHAVLDACSQGLAVSENDRILLANTALARLLGFTHSAELRGHSLSTLLPALRLPAISSPDSSHASTEFCTSDGTQLRISVTPLPTLERELHLLTAIESPRIEPLPPPSPSAGQMEACRPLPRTPRAFLPTGTHHQRRSSESDAGLRLAG